VLVAMAMLMRCMVMAVCGNWRCRYLTGGMGIAFCRVVVIQMIFFHRCNASRLVE